MPRVGSGGRATAVVKRQYPRKLISISRQDCVAGARTCLSRKRIKRLKCRVLDQAHHRRAHHVVEVGIGEAPAAKLQLSYETSEEGAALLYW
jgi:hypothetical protein